MVTGKWRVDDLDVEVVSALLPGHVSRLGDDHLGLANPGPLGPRQVAVGLDRQQAALGAARGHSPADLLITAEETPSHRDDLGLEALQAAKGHGVEPIGREVS